MTSLVLATRNPHKTRELAQLIGPEFSVRDLEAFRDIGEIEETGATFAENAALKATTVSRRVDELVVADDSGLEVDSLGGAPGIYSARYAGPKAGDQDNIAKLLTELSDSEERAAQFRCVLALAHAGHTLGYFEGIVRGQIARETSGRDGFGYDPIFIPDGQHQTFAQLGDAVKNQISHRAKAVAQLRDYLLGTKKGGENRRP